MARVAIFTAVTAVLSQISFPLPSGVPVTLQTLAIALCGYVLGWRLGLTSTGIYILLGTAGVPVFANLSGGPGVLFGMTGGFIWGFLILAGMCGLGMRFGNKLIGISLGIAGLLACHLLGVLQFALVTNTAFVKSLVLVSVPYLVKDIASVAGACLIGVFLRTALKKAHLAENA
jgi:biotin transport system substrate-specific component